MTDTAPPRPRKTAAVCIIGAEILSGATQDANIAHIGRRMAAKGIRLAEVRIVDDIHNDIAFAVNALRHKYDYVFTTGGIGPTHDDITAESIARAFGVSCPVNEEARDYMTRKYAERGVAMNEGRLRMARMPEGAEIFHCDATIAPGFYIENVFIMAGVPSIMRAQLAVLETMIEGGAPVLSRTIQCNLKEGDIALALEQIQHQFAGVDIGSYPHMGQTPALSFILRGTDPVLIGNTERAVAQMITDAGDTPIVPESKI